MLISNERNKIYAQLYSSKHSQIALLPTFYSSHHPQRHRVKHILMIPLLPFSVLANIDLQFRVFWNYYLCNLFLACPAISTKELFNYVQGIAYLNTNRREMAMKCHKILKKLDPEQAKELFNTINK